MSESSFRILVVDDEMQVIEAYRSILEPPTPQPAALLALETELFGDVTELETNVRVPQFVLDYSTQGNEAIDRVSEACQKETPYSIIFIDARMPPGIDGLTAAHAIREIDPFVIIVLVTAYSDVDLKGFVGNKIPAFRFLYLAKPFQPQEIVQLATALSLQWDAERSHRRDLEDKNATLVRLLDEEAWLRKAAESAKRARISMFATVSHELKTPLNAVIGFSEIMLQGIAGPIGNPTYKDYIGEIHTAGRTLLSAIETILEVAQIESDQIRPEFSDVDIAPVLAALVRRHQIGAEARSIELTFTQSSPGPHMLRADTRHITRALDCLIDNALKFSLNGGAVGIQLREMSGKVEVRIEDDGCGMDEDELPYLLTPFGQGENPLSRKYEGLGLGLGLAKTLLELQGAIMTVQSKGGHGTNVVIHFPAANAVRHADPRCASL